MSKRNAEIKELKDEYFDGVDLSFNFDRDIKVKKKVKKNKVPRQPNPKTLGRKIQSGDYFYTSKRSK